MPAKVIATCLCDADGEKPKVTKGKLGGFDGVVLIKQPVDLFLKEGNHAIKMPIDWIKLGGYSYYFPE